SHRTVWCACHDWYAQTTARRDLPRLRAISCSPPAGSGPVPRPPSPGCCSVPRPIQCAIAAVSPGVPSPDLSSLLSSLPPAPAVGHPPFGVCAAENIMLSNPPDETGREHIMTYLNRAATVCLVTVALSLLLGGCASTRAVNAASQGDLDTLRALHAEG